MAIWTYSHRGGEERTQEGTAIKRTHYNLVVTISDRNQFDENGTSTDRSNSTEVDVHEDGVITNYHRIGGDEFRKPELVGKRFLGYYDGLGFVQIAFDSNRKPMETEAANA